MTDRVIQGVFELGFPWHTFDPFLFCVHHLDAYPAGDERMAPKASLAGRNIGMDFEGKDGWRMYHGDVIPGFPRHPHRGFETVTLARQGFIDHSDSLGATARFGNGDVQWMTAGKGVVHSEMFPLVKQDQGNPTELFQIWLNLPKRSKMVDPYFSMFWSDQIGRHEHVDEEGKRSRIVVVAGTYEGHEAPPPPPDSWASNAEADIAIWTIKMEPGAKLTLPPVAAGVQRALYFFDGASITIGVDELDEHLGALLEEETAVPLHNGPEPTELLLLQGRPIGEPVVQHGPFVMNEPAEINQAIADYRRTQFGGWPWKSDGPAHPRTEGRFAKHVDGRIERPEDVDAAE